MPAYRIEITPTALEQLASLPTRKIQSQIGRRIDALGEDPRPPGAKVLDEGAGLLRIRWGDYRIIHRVRQTVRVVMIVRSGDRKDVYRRLPGL